MSEIVACVLALDGAAAAERAKASARRFGLRTVVATADGGPHVIDWRYDFADARNQLVAKIDADWLLWIGPGEELTAFDASAIADLQAPVGAL